MKTLITLEYQGARTGATSSGVLMFLEELFRKNFGVILYKDNYLLCRESVIPVFINEAARHISYTAVSRKMFKMAGQEEVRVQNFDEYRSYRYDVALLDDPSITEQDVLEVRERVPFIIWVQHPPIPEPVIIHERNGHRVYLKHDRQIVVKTMRDGVEYDPIGSPNGQEVISRILKQVIRDFWSRLNV